VYTPTASAWDVAMPERIARRDLLRVLGAAALSGVGSRCASRSAATVPAAVEPRRNFNRVLVRPDRIIRTVVGLRPFRPSGFVLSAQRLGDKTLVHNYGHGGGGVTLSWGTSHMAADLVTAGAAGDCAILGCGAVGLATARLLQKRGRRVTIYAKDLPPNTTSNIAGAQWSPAEVSDPTRTPEFTEQLTRAARISHRYFQELVGDYYGVRWIENYYCRPDTPRDTAVSPIQDLYPYGRVLERAEHPFPVAYVRRFVTMLVEPPIYLNALVRDFQLAGGSIVVRDFADVQSVVALPEPVIVNCTGLGAGRLFGDREIMPIKGQLTVLLPQPEIDYITLTDDLYMFPRRDGILLGGTHERGVWTLEPNIEAAAHVFEGHTRFFQFRA
jgi:glycine/D-amino acid oxidase-like deaminating enzyme